MQREAAPGVVLATISRKDRQGRTAPERVFLRVLPLEWTVGISPSGEGTGEGANPHPAGGYPYVPPQSPRPRRGAVRGDTREKPFPGCKPPKSVKRDRYSPPLRVPGIGNRCTSGLFQLKFPIKTAPVWRRGGSPALFHRAPGLACAGRGLAPSSARTRPENRWCSCVTLPHASGWRSTSGPQNKMQCSTSTPAAVHRPLP